MLRRSREHSVGLISDSGSDSSSSEEIRYCTRCLDGWGIRARLGPRFYLPHSSGKTVIPEDAENWLMCENCLSVYAKYEVKKESKLQDVPEAYDNEFAFGNNMVSGIGGESRRFDKSGKTQYKKKLKEDLSHIKDEDLKRELRKGAKLISFSEKL